MIFYRSLIQNLLKTEEFDDFPLFSNSNLVKTEEFQATKAAGRLRRDFLLLSNSNLIKNL